MLQLQRVSCGRFAMGSDVAIRASLKKRHKMRCLTDVRRCGGTTGGVAPDLAAPVGEGPVGPCSTRDQLKRNLPVRAELARPI